MRTGFFCFLSFFVLLMSTPVYSCDEHDSDKDQLQNVDDADGDKESSKHKKHKEKKHKNSDKDDNNSDNGDPQSVIRGDEKSGAIRGPVLELD